MDLVAHVRPERAVAPPDRVVQLGGGRAVVDEQEEPARERPRPSRDPARRGRGRSRRSGRRRVRCLRPPGARRAPGSSGRSRPRVSASSASRSTATSGSASPRRRTRWTGSASSTSFATTTPSNGAVARGGAIDGVAVPGVAERGRRTRRRDARPPRPADTGWPPGTPGSSMASRIASASAPVPAPCSRMTNVVGSVQSVPDLAQPGRQRGPEDRVQLRRRQEVAAAAGPRVGGAVVAAVGVVQGEVHEPREGHRAGGADLVADPGDEAASSPTSARSVGGSRRRPARIVAHAPQRQAQPRPDQRVAAEDDGDGRRRPRPASGRAATGRRCGRGAAGRRRSGPRRPASRARPRPGDGQAARVCPRSPPRRVGRGGRPANPGPSRSSRAPRTLAGGRWPGTLVRRPRSSTRARVRGRAGAREPGQGAPARSARSTTSSARGSATTALMAASRASTVARSRGGDRPAHRPPSRTRSSGPSISTPRRHRRARSLDLVAGSLRRASAAARCRWSGRAASRARPGPGRWPRYRPSSGCWQGRRGRRRPPQPRTDGDPRPSAAGPRPNPGRRARPPRCRGRRRAGAPRTGGRRADRTGPRTPAAPARGEALPMDLGEACPGGGHGTDEGPASGPGSGWRMTTWTSFTTAGAARAAVSTTVPSGPRSTR